MFSIILHCGHVKAIRDVLPTFFSNLIHWFWSKTNILSIYSAKICKNYGKGYGCAKRFRKTGLQDRLLKAGGRKPVLFLFTSRWVYHRRAAFLKNLLAMKKVAAACDAEAEENKNALTPKVEVLSLLFNTDFLVSIKEVMEPKNCVNF